MLFPLFFLPNNVSISVHFFSSQASMCPSPPPLNTPFNLIHQPPAKAPLVLLPSLSPFIKSPVWTPRLFSSPTWLPSLSLASPALIKRHCSIATSFLGVSSVLLWHKVQTLKILPILRRKTQKDLVLWINLLHLKHWAGYRFPFIRLFNMKTID